MEKSDSDIEQLLATLRTTMPSISEADLHEALTLLTLDPLDSLDNAYHENLATTIETIEHVKSSLLREWEKDVAKWIYREVAYADYPCSEVILWRLGPGMRPEVEVKSFQVNLPSGTRDEIDLLVCTVTDTALGDTNNLDLTTQAYVLYAIFPKKVDYTPRKIFRTNSS